MYCPPRPRPLPAVAALVRVVLQGDGDLLSLLPAKAYRVETGWLGWSRRSILVVNAPELVREGRAEIRQDGHFRPIWLRQPPPRLRLVPIEEELR